MIEENFDLSFVAKLAIKEKQIQQSYRPIIGVHKWFARRPGTMFRSLFLAEFTNKKNEENYYSDNNIKNITIADPFMGGGTPLFEANRLGINIIGYDVNPMSWWVVNEELHSIDIDQYDRTFKDLLITITNSFKTFYETECPIDGETYPVKYFLWIKTFTCSICKKDFDLTPGDVIAKPIRHSKWVLACKRCKNIYETTNKENAICPHCNTKADFVGNIEKSKAKCPHCNSVEDIFPLKKPLNHRMLAIEYAKPNLARKKGRWFKTPDSADLEKFQYLNNKLKLEILEFVPEDKILPGDETNRLLRWGYRNFSQLFNSRQILLLNSSAKIINSIENERIRHALITNFSDLLRYQNLLCRYDTMALKSLDIFSIHGFPVGFITVESNFFGIPDSNNKPVGSGGWLNIWSKYRNAKIYCDKPFEIFSQGKKKKKIYMEYEKIGNYDSLNLKKSIELKCESSSNINSDNIPLLDGVFTDPPYFGNVQYSELMDFSYVWVKKLFNESYFTNRSDTRSKDEVAGNKQENRSIIHYTESLTKVFKNFSLKLKPFSPLVFTFHHNDFNVYSSIIISILDSKLNCTAAIPCPAEMSASIHINNTSSSILDTIFVCRDTEHVNDNIYKLKNKYVEELLSSEVPLSNGSMKCMVYGIISKEIINKLFLTWDCNISPEDKYNLVANQMELYSINIPELLNA